MKILYTFCYLLCSCLGIFAQGIDTVSSINITDKFIELYNSNNLGEAVEMFHYPTTYSSNELIMDKSAVKNILNLFHEEFGYFEKDDTTMTGIEVYQVSVGGGDIQYWTKYPYSLTIDIQGTFKNKGSGFISFRICKIKNNPEIREVLFSLPSSNKDAETIIQKIHNKMILLIQE